MQSTIEEFADWLSCQDGDVLSHQLLARKFKEISRLSEVTQEKIGDVVSRARVFLELKHSTTLINVRGVGYKIATANELAMTTAKWVKRTIMYADRTYRLVDITDRRLIPGALKKVFESSQGNIKTLSTRGKRFVTSFVEYSKTQKKLEGTTNA